MPKGHAHLNNLKPKPPGGCAEVWTGIKPYDVASGIDNFPCQNTVTTTRVQNPLVWNRREQLEHRSAKLSHEASILFISRGVPGLWVHGFKLAENKAPS